MHYNMALETSKLDPSMISSSPVRKLSSKRTDLCLYSSGTIDPSTVIVTQDNDASWTLPTTTAASPPRANTGFQVSHSTSISHGARVRCNILPGAYSESMELVHYDARQDESIFEHQQVKTCQKLEQLPPQPFTVQTQTDVVPRMHQSGPIQGPRRPTKKRQRSPSSKVDQQLALVRKASKKLGAGEACLDAL